MTGEQQFLLGIFILLVLSVVGYIIAIIKLDFDTYKHTDYSSGLTQYDYDVKMAKLYLQLLLLKTQENNTQNEPENTPITPPVLLLK